MCADFVWRIKGEGGWAPRRVYATDISDDDKNVQQLNCHLRYWR